MKTPSASQIICSIEDGIKPLFADSPEAKPLPIEEIERLKSIEQGAENSLQALFTGLHGLGKLIWCANNANDTLSDSQPELVAEIGNLEMGEVGWLIQEIADLMVALDYVCSNAGETLHQNEILLERNTRRSK